MTPPAPVRDGSRYGSEVLHAPAPALPRRCPVCATACSSARAQYCSDACKQRAYRLRQADLRSADTPALATTLRRLGDLVAHTIYECPACGQRFVGERRCPDCNRFCRSLGLGGNCLGCDEPVLVTDLLGL